MTHEAFYGAYYKPMKQAERALLDLLANYASQTRKAEDIQSIVYCCSRIKSPDSMVQKLLSRGLPQTADAAMQYIHDAVGVRAVCAFVDDVYRLVQWLRAQKSFSIIAEKDYCSFPKPNGYRSYHVLVKMVDKNVADICAEIQIRTIANDFWATLEHQLKYKKDLPNEALIRSELKRCADEIASVDMSMQTIREIIGETR